ncbi:MAG: hypothetical protein WBD40_12770 [Tepidisphaeraceae bacterium]
MPSIPERRKLRHSLQHARTAAELELKLEEHGVILDVCLRQRGVDPGVHGVLFAGSISERIATSTSDIDVLVLVETVIPDLQPVDTAIRMSPSSEILVYENGIELNIEILRRDALAESLTAFLDIARALYDSNGLPVLPIITSEQLRLLHRLQSGWAIRREDVVSRWRDEFLVVVLPPYVALLALISFNENLEHARAVADSDDGSLPAAARDCAADALRCMLALNGVANPKARWLPRLAARTLQGQAREVMRQLAEVTSLLSSPSRQQRTAAMAALADVGDRIELQLMSDPNLRTAWSLVREQIHYVNWAE